MEEIICMTATRMFCMVVFLFQAAFCMNCGLSTGQADILPLSSQRRMHIVDERFIPLLFALPASTSADVRFYDDLKSDVEASRARFDGKTSSYMGAPDLGSHIGIRNSHPIGDGSSVV